MTHDDKQEDTMTQLSVTIAERVGYIFEQRDYRGEWGLIETFTLRMLVGETCVKAARLKIGESMPFTGQTYLIRVA